MSLAAPISRSIVGPDRRVVAALQSFGTLQRSFRAALQAFNRISEESWPIRTGPAASRLPAGFRAAYASADASIGRARDLEARIVAGIADAAERAVRAGRLSPDAFDSLGLPRPGWMRGSSPTLQAAPLLIALGIGAAVAAAVALYMLPEIRALIVSDFPILVRNMAQQVAYMRFWWESFNRAQANGTPLPPYTPPPVSPPVPAAGSGLGVLGIVAALGVAAFVFAPQIRRLAA
jgi:hypothetical protein